MKMARILAGALALAALALSTVAPALGQTYSGTPETVYRDYQTDGVPSSGVWNPRKSDIRAYHRSVQDNLTAVINLNSAYPLPVKSLDVFSDSIGFGSGASSSAASWVGLVGTAFGITPTNHSIVGLELMDQIRLAYAVTPNTTGGQVFDVAVGTNDGVFYGPDVMREMTWQNAHMATLAWLALPDKAKWKAQASISPDYAGQPSALTYSAGWSASSSIVSGMSMKSTTAGSSVTFNCWGETCYAAYGIEDSNGGTFTAVVDPATVTMTIASPAVVTETGHGRAQNSQIIFNTSASLPTGLSPGVIYYVKVVDANSYQIAATAGGASINTSGSQSGTHTAGAPYCTDYQSVTLNVSSHQCSYAAAGITVAGYGGPATIYTNYQSTNSITPHASALLRFTGLSKTAHKIVLTVTSATSSVNAVWFDWFAQVAGADAFASGPSVIASQPIRNSNATLEAYMQIYARLIEMDVQKLAKDGLNVAMMKTPATLTPADLVDGTHPGDAGYAKIAQAKMSAYSNLFTARGRASARFETSFPRPFEGQPSYFAPTITCGAHAFGSGNTLVGYGVLIGKLYVYSVQIALGSSGMGTCTTGDTMVVGSFPYTANPNTQTPAISYNQMNGQTGALNIPANANYGILARYDGTWPIANSQTVAISGSYFVQ